MTLFSTAKIHIKIDVDKLFFLHSENFVAYHGHGYRHQGREDVEYHPHGHRHRRRYEQRRLARPVEGIRAELPDNKHLQRHQHRQRHQRYRPVNSRT